MSKYIMSLDQGTTSSRCILFSKTGEIISLAKKEFTQIYPNPGWVEHNPMEIWQTQLEVAKEALKKANASYKNIAAIGITNQRETVIVWDKYTGKPIYNAIVWQCRRTADYCEELKKKGLSDHIHKKTGLLIDAYFSATKVHWLLENVEGARERAEKGELLFGTIDTWLIWNLTGGKVHATDYSNASRTMMFNIMDLTWDNELLELFNIPEAMLPSVNPSAHIYGKTNPDIFGGNISIAGIAGDQQASLFGQGCFEAGEAKNTYGTGCFLLMNTGETPVLSQNGILTTIAWGLNGKVSYALEGSVFIAGAAVQWLRDEMKMIEKAEDTEAIAQSVADTGGVYMVPAFVGLGAPYWDSYARGSITGLTRGSNRAHIVRAVLESIAYQTADILNIMQKESKIDNTCLKVDGGAAANDFLMQFQADILNTKIDRPYCIETTAQGAAYLAGLTVGLYQNPSEIKQNRKIKNQFKPIMSQEQRIEKISGWEKAVAMTRSKVTLL